MFLSINGMLAACISVVIAHAGRRLLLNALTCSGEYARLIDQRLESDSTSTADKTYPEEIKKTATALRLLAKFLCRFLRIGLPVTHFTRCCELDSTAQIQRTQGNSRLSLYLAQTNQYPEDLQSVAGGET